MCKIKDDIKISNNIQINIEIFNNRFLNCPDIIRKNIYLKDGHEAVFVYVEGFIDSKIFQESFLKYILNMSGDFFKDIKHTSNIPVGNIYTVNTIESVEKEIFNGKVVLFIDGYDKAFSGDLSKIEKRTISEPITEKNLKGSHYGFIESLNVNTAILRKKIANSRLKFEYIYIGEENSQSVAIAYVDNMVKKSSLEKVIAKLQGIKDVEFINMGYIEEVFSENKFSLFPLFYSTERPDKASSSLLEGRIVVLMDGFPNCLIAPSSFFSFFQTPDDYSKHWIGGTFFRIIRFLGFLIALLLPSIYVAITSFQYYVIPISLLIPLAESRIRVPFPPIIEALIMEITIELLREASIRLPTYISGTIGIAGGLVISQASVEAGIVSTLFVVIVAVTAISSNVIPSHEMSLAVRILRFFLTIISSILGYLGIILCISIIYSYLLTLKSLDDDYLEPLILCKKGALKDTIIRSAFKKVGGKK